MAPEVMRDAKYSIYSDVYSLVTCFYEIMVCFCEIIFIFNLNLLFLCFFWKKIK